MNLNPDQFRMVSNMKAAPNSQGTLFQGGNAQRYPRGYTPQRQRDVLNSIHPVAAGLARRESPEIRAVIDNVARSTVPANRLTNVEFTAAGSMGRQRGMASGLQIGGSYQSGRRRYPDGSEGTYSRVNVAAGQEGTTTPIHELGHHVSRIIGRPSADYNTTARKGADEGFAETYAETHWRDRRGRPAADFSTNPLKWTSGLNDASRKTFAKHFNKEREGTPSRRREVAASDSFQRRGAQTALFDTPWSPPPTTPLSNEQRSQMAKKALALRGRNVIG